MTVKDLKEKYTGQYADFEAYYSTGNSSAGLFHSDYIKEADGADNAEVKNWELMDEVDYNRSILANTSLTADFDEWFGDKEAKILCVLLKN